MGAEGWGWGGGGGGAGATATSSEFDLFYYILCAEMLLTLVLLNPDVPCLCKQCRSRSVGFFLSRSGFPLFANQSINQIFNIVRQQSHIGAMAIVCH